MNYRETQNAYLNCEKQIYDGVGSYDIPEILPQEIEIANHEIIGFNFAKSEKEPQKKICHFFLDDYQFTRTWRNPDLYVPLLQRFDAVLSPDFSMYADFPKAVQIFNHYRKHWLARYWQENGCRVIPTINWSTPDSFEWCFDGEPLYSTIAISVVGCNKNSKQNQEFWIGFNKAIEVLAPKRILIIKSNSHVDLPDCNGAEIVEVVSGSFFNLGKLNKRTKKSNG